MAKYLQLNRKKQGVTIILFDSPDLSQYALRCMTSFSRGKSTTRLLTPTFTFRHHDRQTVLDVVNGLQLAINYMAQMSGKKTIKIGNYGGEPVYNDGDFTASVFKAQYNPLVTVRREGDGFYRWTIEGYLCQDDPGGLARLGGTVMRMLEKVEDLLQ